MLAAGAILGIMVPMLWILAIGTAITVIQRFRAAHSAMQRFDAAARSGVGEGVR